MPRTLVISSVAGLMLCAIFLGLAVRIGGDDIFHDARSLEPIKPLIDLASHKTWQWNGGDTLALDTPINIRYEPKTSPQGSPQVSLTGPAEVLQHVRVSDGRIAADTNIPRASGKKIEAVVSGATIRKFVVNGGENLDLGEINQERLDLHLNGSGMVSGRGKVDQLNLTIGGSGRANLGGLSVMGDSKVSILGSGHASLSPHGRVRLFIAGSGDLQLLTKPAELRQTIVGSGEARQLTGEEAKQAAAYSYKYDYDYKYDYGARAAKDASRIASDAANAARKGIESAEIHRHVREGIARGLAQTDPSTGSVFVRGSNDTDLGHVEQETLTVTVANSGSLTAEGKVDRLTINVLGSGHVNLGKLAARSVKVTVMGSGSATVAPSEELNVQIMGSGDVHLVTKPVRIERSIMGSGQIVEAR